jgi:hypothetical protein
MTEQPHGQLVDYVANVDWDTGQRMRLMVFAYSQESAEVQAKLQIPVDLHDRIIVNAFRANA